MGGILALAIDPVTSAVIVAVDQAGFVGDGAELPDNRLQLLVHHRAFE